MTFIDRIIERVFHNSIQEQVRQQLALAETDAIFKLGARTLTDSERDRYKADREEVLARSLDAWRLNPLARRIVELTSEYVVGGGISISCPHEPTAAFISNFWEHRLNRMPIRAFEMCDELTRSGNLFVLLTTDSAGMSYLRAIPAKDIQKIQSRENDIEQPVAFFPKGSLDDLDPQPYPAYDPLHDDPANAVMLQYAINRPAGRSGANPIWRPCCAGSRAIPPGSRTAPASTATATRFCMWCKPNSTPKPSANSASRRSTPIRPSPAVSWWRTRTRSGASSTRACSPPKPTRTGWRSRR